MAPTLPGTDYWDLPTLKRGQPSRRQSGATSRRHLYPVDPLPLLSAKADIPVQSGQLVEETGQVDIQAVDLSLEHQSR
jgi:hypothetical protein